MQNYSLFLLATEDMKIFGVSEVLFIGLQNENQMLWLHLGLRVCLQHSNHNLRVLVSVAEIKDLLEICLIASSP